MWICNSTFALFMLTRAGLLAYHSLGGEPNLQRKLWLQALRPQQRRRRRRGRRARPVLANMLAGPRVSHLAVSLSPVSPSGRSIGHHCTRPLRRIDSPRAGLQLSRCCFCWRLTTSSFSQPLAATWCPVLANYLRW